MIVVSVESEVADEWFELHVCNQEVMCAYLSSDNS
jgi:hypothetical protein